MTRRDVFNFIRYFNKLKLPKENGNHTLKFALGVNKSRLEPLYNVIMENIDKIDGYQEYYTKQSELHNKYVNNKTNVEDQVKVDPKSGTTMIDIDDNKYKEFVKAQEALNIEYKDVIEKVKASEAKFQEYLNDEIDSSVAPSIAKVKITDIPMDIYDDEEYFYLIGFMVQT